MKTCDCPIDAVAQIVGSKWIILLMRDMFLGYSKFSEFLARNEGLSNKVLTQKLKELQEYGLIFKCLDEQGKIKYCLSAEGVRFKSVLKALGEYGQEYCTSTSALGELLTRLDSVRVTSNVETPLDPSPSTK